MARLTFEKAAKNINNRYPYLTLLEYNGSKKIAKFLDHKYGEFEGRYDYVLIGDKNHKERANFKSRTSINEANKKLNNRHSHLTLLEYNGSKNIAKFLDNEYGEFSANYKNVFMGKQQHPERTRLLKKQARNKKDIKEKIKKTNIEKYGCENPSQNFTIKNKKEKTTLKNYGVKNPFQSEEIKEKSKKTSLKKYGVDKALKNPIIKRKQEQTVYNKLGVNHALQSEIIQKKLKQTNLKKYGCENLFQLEEIKEKSKQTNLEKYGVEYATQNKDIREKTYKTNLKKYGCIIPSQNKVIKNKIKQTMLNNGKCYNIDGHSASEYYRNNNIEGSMTTFIKNIRNFGIEEALKFEPHKTNIENIISLFLDKNNIDYIFNRSIHKDYIERPDFLIKDKNLIIECDGIYYHSDAGATKKIIEDKNFHKKRQEKYKELGYSSLFFREDEIINKTHIVESIILAKLGLISNRVYARKCKIRQIKPKEAAKFFEENHLMGRGTGKCFALFYNDEIVSAIRVVNKKNYLDVSRFCNKLNTSVAGGLSKLLKHIIKEYQPSKIQSFVDMRYGDGQSLEKIGFVAKTNYVSFKWCKGIQTFHRMAFPKNSGYEVGLSKIWDCGQKKFELIV